MSEPTEIIMGANQPSEIWQGINKDEGTIARFELVMQLFSLTQAEIDEIRGQQK